MNLILGSVDVERTQAERVVAGVKCFRSTVLLLISCEIFDKLLMSPCLNSFICKKRD